MTLEEDIVEKAGELFMTYGIKAVSMDAVAQKVGISKRTLYESFSSKDELLAASLIHQQEIYREEMTQMVGGKTDFVEILLTAFRFLHEKSESVNPLFTRELSRYGYLAATEKFQAAEKERHMEMLRFFERGRNEGYILESFDLEIIVGIFEKMHSVMKSIHTSKPVEPNVIFRHVYGTLFRGIFTDKGREKIDEYLLGDKVTNDNKL